MQSLVAMVVAGIALFALGCLAFGLLVVGAAWGVRRLARAIAHFAAKANQQARSCYNEPLQPIVEVRGEA